MTSSPNPFDYFGLNPETASERDLKKAYAEKLKTIRPEDDREGFMTLRNCFERARREIRWREEDAAYEAAEREAEAAETEDVLQPEESAPAPTPVLKQEKLNPVVHDQWHKTPSSGEPDPHSPEVHPAPVPQPTEPEADPVQQAMDDIAALAKSPFAGSSFAPWQAIIDRDDLQTIDNYQMFSDRLRTFICEETGLYDEPEEGTDIPTMRFPNWLTVTVLKGLGNTFGWHKQHTRHYWHRSENDWIAKLGIEYAKPGHPAERKAKTAASRNRVMGGGAERTPLPPHSSGGQVYTERKRNVLIYWGWIALRVAIAGFIFYSIFRD